MATLMTDDMVLSEKTWSIDIQCDVMDVTGGEEADPAWEYRDNFDHLHKWTFFKTKSPECKTVKWVEDGVHYYADDPEYPVPFGHLECTKCGDKVEPKYRPCEARHMQGKQQATGSFAMLGARKPPEPGRTISLGRFTAYLKGRVIVTAISLQDPGFWVVDFVSNGKWISVCKDDHRYTLRLDR